MNEIEVIDRTVYKHLLDEFVRRGLTVDPALYVPGQEDQYAAAVAALKVSNGMGIISRVYGIGATANRDAIEDSQIVIDRLEEEPGGIGGQNTYEYVPYTDADGVNKFRKYKRWDRTYDFTYELRMKTKNANMDREMQSAISRAFPMLNYLKRVDVVTREYIDEDMLLVEYVGSNRMLGTSFLERTYRIQFKDVVVREMELVTDDIYELTEVVPVINGNEFPTVSVSEFLDLSGLPCANLNHPVRGLTATQIVNCLLRRVNFSSTHTQSTLTDVQIAQLRAWLVPAGEGDPVSILRETLTGSSELVEEVPPGGVYQIDLLTVDNGTTVIHRKVYVHGDHTYTLLPVGMSYVDKEGATQPLTVTITGEASGKYTTDHPPIPAFAVTNSVGAPVARGDISSPTVTLPKQVVRNSVGTLVDEVEVGAAGLAPDANIVDEDGQPVAQVPAGTTYAVQASTAPLTIVDDHQPYPPQPPTPPPGVPIVLMRLTIAQAEVRNSPGLITEGGDVLLDGQPLIVTYPTERREFRGTGTHTIAALVSGNSYLVARSMLGSMAYEAASNYARVTEPMEFGVDSRGRGLTVTIAGEQYIIVVSQP